MFSLQELSDREEIRQLCSTYSDATDRHDSAAYAATFTEDGLVDCSEMGTPDMRGHEAIAAVVDAFIEIHDSYAHFVTNHGIRWMSQDEAKGWCYFLLMGRTKGGKDTHMYGRYEDDYVRTPDGWRFKVRKLVPLGPITMDYELPDPAEV